mgnify:FL=1|jgi:hypothetical protein|tara:strand:- start:469 stop:1086 length:618 start_codon:yes stop_codon:yes gene_type:complete
MARKKYKIISEDLQKNLIDFLDEIQFDAAKEGTTEDLHKVNFCNWAINELLNGYDAFFKDSKKNPNKKSRQDYVDETFMDWNLPEMSDDEYKKLVDNFDNFLRAWEKEYYKDNPKKKTKTNKKFKGETTNKKNKTFKPHLEDVAEWCTLEEVEEFLKDDPELSDYDRFELYYDERERRREIETGYTYEELMKATKLKSPKKPKKK